MTVRLSAGGTVSFRGSRIGQLISCSISEGENDTDGGNFANTSVDLNLQFDRGLAQHRIARGTTGTLSIVNSSGQSAITISNCRLVGRTISMQVGQIVTGSLRFESLRAVSF